MDDYAKEIADLQAQVDRLVEEEAESRTIVELEMQLEVLRALYRQAGELYVEGKVNPDLQSALAMRGYGGWTLDNVYAFVYERAVDFPEASHRAFVNAIRGAHFEDLLNSPPLVGGVPAEGRGGGGP